MRDVEEVADADNAYVYLLGFSVPRDGDPATDRRRARGLDSQDCAADPSLGIHDPIPVPKDAPRCRGILRVAAWTSAATIDAGTSCFEALSGARDTIERVTAEQSWLIDRYRLLFVVRRLGRHHL